MSKVSDVSDVMRKLLWKNVVEAWVRRAIVAIPVLGWSVFKDVFIFVVETYLVEPLFVELARYGVFTTIDFQNALQYDAYKKEAEKIIVLQDLSSDWKTEEREVFRNAARNLIVFHLS